MNFEKRQEQQFIPQENELPLDIKKSEAIKMQGIDASVWRALAGTPEGREKLIVLKEVKEESFASDEEMKKSKQFYDFLKESPLGKFVPDTLYLKARKTADETPRAYRLQRAVEGRRIDELTDEELYKEKGLIRELMNFIDAAIDSLEKARELDINTPDFYGSKILSNYFFDPRHSSNIMIGDMTKDNEQRVFFVDTAPQIQQIGCIGKTFQREIGGRLQLIQLKRWKKKLREMVI